MTKEKEIWLEPEEIQLLLEGGLYWNDIESKFSKENADSLKQRIKKEDALDIDEIIREASLNKNSGETKNKSFKDKRMDTAEAYNEEDVRAILLGENRPPVRNQEIEKNSAQTAAAREEMMDKTGKEEILIGADEQKAYEDRQMRQEIEMRQELYGLMPVEEAEMSPAEKINFSGLGAQAEPPENQKEEQPLKDFTYSEEMNGEQEERGPSFGGLKLVLLLVAVALITFGFWYYFVS